MIPDDLDRADFPEGSMRKSRSHSFSSSMKKLFSKKKKGAASRESSVSRASSYRYGDTSRDISVAQASPDIAYRDSPGQPLSHPGQPSTQQGTNPGQPYQGQSAAGDYGRDYGMYSTSVPPTQSPLYDR